MPRAGGGCFGIHAFQLVYSFFLHLSCYPALLPLKLPAASTLAFQLPLNFPHPQCFSCCFLHLQLLEHEEPQRGAPSCSSFAVQRTAHAAGSIQQAPACSSGITLPRSGSSAVHHAVAEAVEMAQLRGRCRRRGAERRGETKASIMESHPAVPGHIPLQPGRAVFSEQVRFSGSFAEQRTRLAI